MAITTLFSLRYNQLSREIRDFATKVSELDPKLPLRTEVSGNLLEKLYGIGLISTKWDLQNAIKITASSFCRRRLPIVMVRSKLPFIYIKLILNSLQFKFNLT